MKLRLQIATAFCLPMIALLLSNFEFAPNVIYMQRIQKRKKKLVHIATTRANRRIRHTTLEMIAELANFNVELIKMLSKE